PFDALELINPDTSWRLHFQQAGMASKWKLFTSLLDYPFRPSETLTALLQRPDDILSRWSGLTAGRRVVAVAGADAHAKLAPRNADPGDNRAALPIPSYAASFGMMSVHVRPEHPLTGQAASDAAAILGGLRSGRVYTAVDGLATPPAFELRATGARAAGPGDEVSAGSPLTLTIRSN